MITLLQGDCLEVLKQFPEKHFACIVTSCPYNLGISYPKSAYNDAMPRERYLEWCGAWLKEARRVAADDASFFLNVAGKPTDPLVPYLVLFKALESGWQLANQIVWCKSLTITKDEKEISVGHYKPLNSDRFVNDCQEPVFELVPAAEDCCPENGEYVFHLTSGKVKLARKAIGVDYVDRCLSKNTYMIAKIEEKILYTRLLELKNAFDKGRKVEIPSWDFTNKKIKWTQILGFTEPTVQEVVYLRTKNRAGVACSRNHKFPILKCNYKLPKGQDQIVSCLTVSEIEERQKRWTSADVLLYSAQSFLGLLPPPSHSFYTYELGYVLGLWVAEGSFLNKTAVSFSANENEGYDPLFGGLLETYFKGVLGANLRRHFSKNTKGMSMSVESRVFKAVIKDHITGRYARDKSFRMSKVISRGVEFIRGIIDGFIYGDGTVKDLDTDQWAVGICHNAKLIEDMRVLCLLVGYEFRRNKNTAHKTSFAILSKALPEPTLASLEDNIQQGLKENTDPKIQIKSNFWIRKNLNGKRRQPKQNGLITEALSGIENMRKAETLDIQVAEDHGLFFIGNGMMVHNSNLTRWGSASEKRCRGNVWQIAYETKNATSYPATFPVELPRRCLRLHGLEKLQNKARLPGNAGSGGVLDMFSGTGTTMKACQELGLTGTGIEISEVGHKMAKQRLGLI